LILILIGIFLLLFLLPRLLIEALSISSIKTVENLPNYRTAVVFGAGLNRDGTPTNVLRDRVKTAVDLYKAGIVDKILLSGDNRFVYYNEPAAMYQYAIALGVPSDALVMDYAGRRTYDTCYRAKEIFGLAEAILITQRFHLPRAIFICKSIGIKTAGLSADSEYYHKSSLWIWNVREILASAVALWDVWIAKPLPVLGEPEPIYPPETMSKE